VPRPEAQVCFHDLRFPSGASTAWLEDVDAAFCHPPAVEAGVSVQAVRVEPRAVVHAPQPSSRDRAELGVADVLDETFVQLPHRRPAGLGTASTASTTIAAGRHGGDRPDRALTSRGDARDHVDPRGDHVVPPLRREDRRERRGPCRRDPPCATPPGAVLSLVWNERTAIRSSRIMVAVAEALALDDLDSRAEVRLRNPGGELLGRRSAAAQAVP